MVQRIEGYEAVPESVIPLAAMPGAVMAFLDDPDNNLASRHENTFPTIGESQDFAEVVAERFRRNMPVCQPEGVESIGQCALQVALHSYDRQAGGPVLTLTCPVRRFDGQGGAERVEQRCLDHHLEAVTAFAKFVTDRAADREQLRAATERARSLIRQS